MSRTQFTQIQNFLSLKRLAFIGISRDPKNYTRLVYNEFKQRNYDVIPVNPNADEIEGVTCYHSVDLIEPKPDGVFIFTSKTPPSVIVQECIQQGIKNIWIRNGLKALPGLKDIPGIDKVNLIQDQCPLMFLPESQLPHRIHGFIMRLTGGYPVK